MTSPELLLSKLYSEGGIRLGEFMLKGGAISPIYIDLRILVSAPEALTLTSNALCELFAAKGLESQFDYIVGVPYGALALATLVSNTLRLPMLMKRKEAKNYGTRQLIEGRFEPGKRALVIEDVVTSGLSILETVEELKRVGLCCSDVLCVLDREQGGLANLEAEGIRLHSVATMSNALDFLLSKRVINEQRKQEIRDALNRAIRPLPAMAASTTPVASSGSGGASASHPQHPANKRLWEIMDAKKTNLCLAADSGTADEILAMAEKVGNNICALKLHHDIVSGFNTQFVTALIQLASSKNFLLLEDRKYADTGNTMRMQIRGSLVQMGGDTPVSTWAHLVTVHSLPGAVSIAALQSVISDPKTTLMGCLLIAEVSTANALTSLPGYKEGTVKIAESNPQLVAGFVCQRRCQTNAPFLNWTPGVNLAESQDGMGQKWRGVEKAIVEDGCDIVIVGRGITQAKEEDAATAAGRYARAGWEALMKRRGTC